MKGKERKKKKEKKRKKKRGNKKSGAFWRSDITTGGESLLKPGQRACS
jgi:hypothetical protein